MAVNVSRELGEGDLGNGVGIIDPLRNHRWDRFVQQHPYGWITHLSGWKRVLDHAFPHMTGYYLALKDSAGGFRGALPVYAVESWLTGRRLVSIPFATLCDPLVTDAADMELLSEAVLRLAQRLGISRVEIRTAAAAHLLNRDRFHADCVRKHHFLPLCPDPELVRQRFHRSCVRQRIARAERSDLHLIRGKRESDVMEFYLLHCGTRKRKGLPPHPYLLVKALWQTFAQQGLVELLLCRKGEETVAGLLLFKYKGRVSIEYSAVNALHNDSSPVHFLFWNAIKEACLTGYRVLDFGQTSVRNTSLMEFKSHWGAEVSDLPHFIYPNDPANSCAAGEESMAEKLLHFVCNKAPDTALSYLGDFCYRHLG
ncbi:lipid II:glycine glycyltransferase FemX [Geomonas subterranea]|uniref:GNAT family N-acetyltransferase n=1 Tax=Geomonas subterranea TaxID=2847989 RepID=A0ABX8LFW4_9BACT|nr:MULTISPECIES: GNAT family N-acetyltransferase [Geomonas]QXE90236.1 GNAT family N-acetyltransferase [Geomonas subterranea]QXM07638.1 GNAT family N-acetyltransferase [Geomonas subterranea]